MLPDWWVSQFGVKPYVCPMDCMEGLKRLPDNVFDACVTDPPFGVGFNYGSSFKDKKNPDEYWAWLNPIYNEILRCVKPGGFIAIWQTQLYYPYFWDWFGKDIHIYAACKNFVQMRKTPINYGYDPVIMLYKGGADPLRNKHPNRNIDYFVSDTASLVSDTTSPESKFPCPRPLDVVAQIVDNFTAKGSVVVDPFIGSGTLLKACRETGRIGLGFEIDKKWKMTISDRSLQSVPMLEEFNIRGRKR